MNTEKDQQIEIEKDSVSSSRKEDHIDLAFKSETSVMIKDSRFNYEPLFKTIDEVDLTPSIDVCGKTINYPIWISSMTGGTQKASIINQNLARLCGEFKLSMGLGSCRQLLYDDKRLEDFKVRTLMPDSPLLVNLGVAQIEELIVNKQIDKIETLIHKLKADGLIIHVNPLQEWLQPEGDKFRQTIISTIEAIIEKANYPIIVKEVGQGFGPKSLKHLSQLPLEALDLAGFGGTNFSKLELLRANELSNACNESVYLQGHTCQEMITWLNSYIAENNGELSCRYIILSGGIKNYMDGYYLKEKLNYPSIYAQASGFLAYATNYEELKQYLALQIEGLKMANAYFTVKE